MWYFLCFAIGISVGGICAWIVHHARSSSGTLRIDHSNPEKDIYRFEVDDIDNLSRKKRIILKVDNNADLSQK